MPEEDKISLVVEGDNSSSSELGLLGKQRGKQPADSNSYFAIEIVQDKFGDVLGCNCMMFDLFLVFNAGYFKNCQHSFKMPHQQFPAVCKSEDHNMSEVQIFGVLVNLVQFHIATRVEGNIVENHHDLPQEVVDFHGRFQLGSDENFNGAIVLEDFIELIEHGFIVFLSKLFSSFLFILYGDGLLSFLGWQFLSFFSLLHFNLVFDGISFDINLDSFLFIFDLVGVLSECSAKLGHGLGSGFDALFLVFTSFFFVSFSFFSHCCF